MQTTYSPNLPPKTSHVGRNVAIIILIIGIAVAAIIYIEFTSPVKVSGSISMVGSASSPNEIVFTSSHGETFSVQVTDVSGRNGLYSVVLPNRELYSVQIRYTALGIGGTCDAGSFFISTFASQDVTQNFSC